MSTPFTQIPILGMNFIKATNTAFLEQIKKDSLAHKNRFIVTANPEIVLAAQKDSKFADIIAHADYTTADGIGIVKGARILNTPLPERITGYDTMCSLLKWANEQHKKVYFLGAKPAVITDVLKNVHANYPSINISGFHDGYFNDDATIIKEISDTQPDFVFIALGFPKQEFFIAKNRFSSPSIWMGVGGSFDVLAGHVKRAPDFWVNHHIEWLYRLLKEPSRFFRMLALPKYLLLVYKEKFTKK
ncbi:WecB/TagA/CpsF family glycosyltransferase [Ligilactobacillus sp. WILCCON 0076]|uniref:N-acetylglucosaminyldiphosphoundecaprenol N-acetyl-beta-D-mannosaminyltransferase n=1 Tax=Ligilactobacillus ubinensis TaxID=2876789 RepID=A0A9X2JM32_9LACO|nr:WecB/TagA/CpsF family glycosyltransferase [Ligilactobacillus ubinensis]MCP0887504.1 WecB/TagA/CpsF family glycosyltransferase [Ligilactobacillus ubinensis]